nr:hypothetical protein [uncultured Carboxylicivirga sp.]
MSKVKIITLLLFGILANKYLQAQDYKHLFDSTPPLGEKFDTKSDRLIVVTKEKSIKIVRFFYGDSNYNIALTKDDKNVKIGLQIVNTENLEVLWDNSDKNYQEEIDISLKKSCRVAIVISLVSENKTANSHHIVLTVRSFKKVGSLSSEETSPPPSSPIPNF